MCCGYTHTYIYIYSYISGYPQAFAKKEERATIFVDFYKKNEDLDLVYLMHRRRIIKTKLSKAVYRPKTEAELLDKFKDPDYVKLVINDATRRNRAARDKFCPNDNFKIQYWVLDDETLEFTNAQELEFALECQQALSNEEAQKLTSDGSMFDSAGELPSGGACPLEVARLSDVHSQIGGPGFSLPSGQQMLVDAPAADSAEAKAAAKKEATAAKAAAKKVADDLKKSLPVPPDTSLEKAKKHSVDLVTQIGHATKLIFDLDGSDGGPMYQAQIKSCITAMTQQKAALAERIILAIADPPDYYDTMNDAAATMIRYFKDRAFFAKALVGAAKRKEKEASDANAKAS